jgi:hypothetical protein
MVEAAADTIVARADATAAAEVVVVDLRLLRPRLARVYEGIRTEPASGRRLERTPRRSRFLIEALVV